MHVTRRLIGAVMSALRARRSTREARDVEIEIELSHDSEWARFRRERVPLCIATRHVRS